MESDRSHAGIRGVIASAIWLSVVSVATPPAFADEVLWETVDLLADFFPEARRVTYQSVELTDSDLDRIAQATGRRPVRREWLVFVAVGARDEVQGYAIFDEEPGQHQPITFAVQFDPRGVVVRQELVVYREPFGGEIRSARFRRQFVGHGAGEPMTDVATVTGATISSESMRIGVRRAVEVMALILRTRPERLMASAGQGP